MLGEDWTGSAEAAEAAGWPRGRRPRSSRPGGPWPRRTPGCRLPAEPHLALWQALTTLREHRGDGHNAALLKRGDRRRRRAHVLAAAAGRSTREWLQRARGWDDEAWDAAAEELTERRWLDEDGLTAEGLAIVAAVEADTDRLALGPWRALGDAGCDRLAELLAPVRRAVVAAGEWPAGNPIGAPTPVSPAAQVTRAALGRVASCAPGRRAPRGTAPSRPRCRRTGCRAAPGPAAPGRASGSRAPPAVDQRLGELPRLGMGEREVRAAAGGVARRGEDDAVRREPRLGQRGHQLGQRAALHGQPLDAGLGDQPRADVDGRHAQHRRRPDAEPLDARRPGSYTGPISNWSRWPNQPWIGERSCSCRSRRT